MSPASGSRWATFHHGPRAANAWPVSGCVRHVSAAPAAGASHSGRPGAPRPDPIRTCDRRVSVDRLGSAAASGRSQPDGPLPRVTGARGARRNRPSLSPDLVRRTERAPRARRRSGPASRRPRGQRGGGTVTRPPRGERRRAARPAPRGRARGLTHSRPDAPIAARSAADVSARRTMASASDAPEPGSAWTPASAAATISATSPGTLHTTGQRGAHVVEQLVRADAEREQGRLAEHHQPRRPQRASTSGISDFGTGSANSTFVRPASFGIGTEVCLDRAIAHQRGCGSSSRSRSCSAASRTTSRPLAGPCAPA